MAVAATPTSRSCCWALMLVMFAAGFASVVWMAVPMALMVLEKTHAGGARDVSVTGVALPALACVVAVSAAAPR